MLHGIHEADPAMSDIIEAPPISAGRYTGIAMLLHWLVAALIIGNVALIWTVNWVPEDQVRAVIDTHKSLGITVLGLAVLRLLWRFANPPPAMPAGTARWEKRFAHVAHWALYLLIFALPISGWLHDSAWKDAATHPMYLFGLFEWPRIAAVAGHNAVAQDRLHDQLGSLHIWLGYGLYALFGLHIAGALKHQFIDGHAELQRILPGAHAPK